MALRLGKTISEVQCGVTSTEFIRWMAYFDQEWREQDRTIYQLAQIAYQVYLLMFILGGTPTRKIEDFVLQFSTTDSKQLEAKDEDFKKEAESVKAEWTGFITGMASQGSRRKKKRKVGKEEFAKVKRKRKAR